MFFFHLNVVPSEKSTQKSEANFLEIGFLLNTGGVISVLICPTLNAIKTHLHQSKCQYEENSETKARRARNQLISIKGVVKLTIPLFRDHSATLAITFAIADTKYKILDLPFLKPYRKSIDTKHSHLILRYNLYNTAYLLHIPFLKTSHKQPPV